MSPDAWVQTSQRLAGHLAALEPDGTLVLAEKRESAEEPRRSWWRRGRPAPVRYVQFVRTGDMITGECVGSTAWGGYVEIDDDQDRRLRDLGWKAPDQLAEALRGSPNYRVDAPLDGAAALAGMGVAALEVLGVSPETELDWRQH